MPDERTTSFAKSVEGLVHEESALDRARRVRDAFNERNAGTEHQKQDEAERLQSGSRTVQEDAPVLKPAPAGPLRHQPDSQAAYGRLAEERAEANQKLAAARRAHEAIKNREGQQRSRDPERDRER